MIQNTMPILLLVRRKEGKFYLSRSASASSASSEQEEFFSPISRRNDGNHSPDDDDEVACDRQHDWNHASSSHDRWDTWRDADGLSLREFCELEGYDYEWYKTNVMERHYTGPPSEGYNSDHIAPSDTDS